MNKNMSSKPNYNNWHIEVIPRQAGDFGFCSISSFKYTESQAKNLQSNIINNIKRHVDGIDSCNVIYESWFCDKCGEYYDDKKDAENCKC